MHILKFAPLLVTVILLTACGGGGGGSGGKSSSSIAPIDADGDSYTDSIDAFPNNAQEWLDTDKDGVGDNADTDIDGDGTLNTQDAFPKNPSEQKDTDLDGIGDNADPDIDGDGVLNAQDTFPKDPLEWLDADSDGTGDNADTMPLGDTMVAWGTFQGNAQHTGLINETLDKSNFNTRWTKNLAVNGAPQGAAGDGRLFVNLQNVLYALSTSTGETLWTKPLTKSNPPAYADGIVYVETVVSNAAVLWALNATNGELLFQAPIQEQWNTSYAPTIADGTIYMPGGYYSSTYALDAKTGEQKWSLGISQYDQSMPTVTADYSIIYSGSNTPQLNVIDRKTGTLAFTITDTNYVWNGWSSNQAAVVSNDYAVVIYGGRLIQFNLTTKSLGWDVVGQFTGQPVIKEGQIYTINNGKIEVRNLATGSLVSTITNTNFNAYGFSGNLILTNNLLFIGDSVNTYAYDLSTQQKVWNLSNKGGAMFVSDDALFVMAYSSLSAINVKGDIDKDNLPDWWEKSFGKNIDPIKDLDNDELTGAQEFTNNTNPLKADTDGDGISDGKEVKIHLTSPLSNDTDKDNVSDYDEVTTHNTNPNLADSDTDGLGDAAEIAAGLNPLDATDADKDNDNDGFSNRHEVLANTNVNSATATPQITDWGMLQGNSKHNNYQPLILNAEAFKLRWSTKLEGGGSAAATGNGKIFLRNNSNIVSLNAGTGEFVWNYPFYGSGASFANSTVYSHRGGHESTAFVAINSETGALKFSSTHSSQWGNYSAPTIFEGHAYVNGGYFGGLVAFNATNGATEWEIGSPIVEWADFWEPAVSELGLFAIAQSKLKSLSRANGSVLFEIDSPQPVGAQTPIIGSKGNVITRGASIVSYDIASRKVAWQTPNVNYYYGYSSIAVGNGQVYALSQNTITVFDETNGNTLWSWTRDNTNLSSNIVVTASHLFVSDGSTTYAVDLSSHILTWSYAKGGQHLSIGREGALFVVNDAEVFAIEIEGDKDGDAIPDWWERNYGGNLIANADIDNDGLTNLEEFSARTNPTLNDTDGDTISDSQEVKTLHTDPLAKDSDKDGLADNIEVGLSTNPLVTDSDGDGIDDQAEVQNTLNPNSATDANLDTDNDGFSNKQEIFAGTNINSATDFPIAHDWGIIQGNASHDGFQPLVLETDNFSLRWKKTFATNIYPVSTGGGKLFVTTAGSSNTNLHALNPVDASTLWTHEFGSIYSMSSASFAGNKVYTRGDYALWGFNADTGAQFFRTPSNEQGYNQNAPTLFDGRAYLDSGYYNRVTAFSLANGSLLWESIADGSSVVEPAVKEQSVYSAQNNKIVVSNHQTGAEQFRIETPANINTLVLSKRNNILVVSNNIKSINLTTRDTNWSSVQENINGFPSVGNGNVYFISSGTLYSLNELSGELQWSWTPPGSTISSNIVTTLSHIFVSTGTKTYAIDSATGLSNWSYNAGGQLSLGRDGALYITAGTQLYAINITGDKDSDGIADWWEELYGLNPLSNADASQDIDADGLTNLEEFGLKTKPNLADSDGDTLSDYAEARTYHTSPVLVDTDFDKLSDKDEVLTHLTNALVADTDGDGFSDGDEILFYLTNANNAASKPTAISNYSQSFESTPVNWTQPSGSNAAWTLDSSTASNGSQSLKSGQIGNSQHSDVEFSGLFAASTLTFDAKISSESCCDVLVVYLDDVLVLQRNNADSWMNYSINLPQGEHKIRWSYTKDSSSVGGSDAVWIDNINIH